MTDVLDVTALVLMAIAGVLALARVVRTGSLPDKLLGADLLTVTVASGVAVGAGITLRPYFIDVVVIVGAIGFLSTVTVARFVEQRGARLPDETFAETFIQIITGRR